LIRKKAKRKIKLKTIEKKMKKYQIAASKRLTNIKKFILTTSKINGNI
jgi:hypothetical protein